MAETKNSLTTLIQDLIKTQKNGLEIINKLSDVVSSKSDTVEIDILDENNVIKKVVVPSYGNLQSQIERLDENVKALSGLGDANSVLQLADGSFRKVLQDSLQKEANSITSINTPGTFSSRANWFFESFLNPLLYVSFDFGSQIKANTERVEVSRFILTLDTEDQLEYFNQNFLGRSNINYDEFLDALLDQNMQYYLDQDVISLPPRDLKLYGDFSVIRVLDNPITETIDGEQVTRRDLKFKLDKLTYSDRDSRYLDTQQLKIGDSLVINNEKRNTRYQITAIDEGTSTVSVKLIEGFDKVTTGTNNLSFFGDNNAASLVEVNVGFNEYTVLFVKPVDPDSEIKATNWSPGVGYFSNELTISDVENGERTLDQYYKDEVVDFGAFLFSMAKEGTPPSILAETPYKPIINVDNFKVVQINKHVTDTPVITEIRKLHTEKVKLKNEISQYDVAISKKQNQLANKKYKSKVSRDTDRNELNLLIEEKTSRSKLYSSAVRDINTKSTESGVNNVEPKYRLRGFWPIPQAKFSSQTNPQEVVQFAIQYRYVTRDGGANQAEQLEFTDNDGTTRRGSFSTWNETKTAVRQRVTDPETGLVSWIIEDAENSDAVNINQLDLSIRSGEGIEFRVKSISEAGYPSNPAESEYSEIYRVDFPLELESTITLDQILEEATKEGVRISLQEELQEKGIYRHVQESTESGGRYFAHSALELSSGFVDEQQVPISLFEKLKALDTEIQNLNDRLDRAKGKLRVRVIDEDGNEYPIQDNAKLQINAPNYKDEVEPLTVKKGVIITKTYFLVIDNERASDIELYSKIYGPINRRANASWDTTGNPYESYQGVYAYDASDSVYNRRKKYDQVPIMVDQNTIVNYAGATANPFFAYKGEIPYQSSQMLGQYLNFRYTSVDGTENIYTGIDSTGIPLAINNSSVVGTSGSPATDYQGLEYSHETTLIQTPTSVNSFLVSPFSNKFVVGPRVLGSPTTATNPLEVFSGIDTNIISPVYDEGIWTHVTHPQIQNGEWSETSPGSGLFDPGVLLTTLESNATNSKLATLTEDHRNGNKQIPFFYDDVNDRSAKMGFDANDQYLLGGRSCGSYFFPKMSTNDLPRVDGNSAGAIRRLRFGNTGTIEIPLIFQYRMTDFFGAGTKGIGLIGGKLNAKLDQLIYNKTLGIDLYHGFDETFSFDITVTAKYKSNRIEAADTPQRSFENAVNDLNDSLTTALNSQPNISR